MMPQEIIVCLEKSKRLPFDKSVDKLQDGAYIKRLQGLFCVLQFFSDLDVLGAVFLTGAAFGAVIHGSGVLFEGRNLDIFQHGADFLCMALWL